MRQTESQGEREEESTYWIYAIKRRVGYGGNVADLEESYPSVKFITILLYLQINL